MTTNTQTSSQEQNILVEYAQRLLKHEGAAEMLGLGPMELAAIEMQAFQLYERGRYDEATSILQGVITLENQRPMPYLILADIAYKGGDFETALQLYTVTDSLAPENPVVLAKLGEALVRAGKPAEAAQALGRALRQPELLEEGMRRRAEVLYKVVIEHIGN